MQDRYAGDIGDFGKFALLRALPARERLGVCWYMTDGVGEKNNDGQHREYLQRPERFRKLDPFVFDKLVRFNRAVDAGEHARSVVSLEAMRFLPRSTVFHRMPTPRHDRDAWRNEMVDAVAGCDLVLLDPDNGLETQTLTHKSVAIDELDALRSRGRSILLYHHQTRFPGGARAEVASLERRLRVIGFTRIDAVRLRPYSSRYYLLLDGTKALVAALDAFAHKWGDEVERIR